jgi:hypothetical protein
VNWRTFNWRKQVILPVALAAMETAWLAPWLGLWGKALDASADRPVLSASTVFLLLIAAQLLTEWMVRSESRMRRARYVLVGAGLVAIAAVARTPHGDRVWLDPAWLVSLVTGRARDVDVVFSATLLTVYLWWRGIGFGRALKHFDDIAMAFWAGVAGLIAYAFLAIPLAGDATFAHLTGRAQAAVFGFFAVSLLGLSLARLEDERKHDRGGDFRFSRQWLSVLVGVVGMLMLASLVLTRLLTFDLVTAVVQPLRFLGPLLWYLFEIVAYALGLIAWGVIAAVRFLLHPQGQPQPPPPPDFSLDRLQQEAVARGLSPETAVALRWVALGLALLAIIVLLSRAVFRWVSPREDEVEEDRESVWTWQDALLTFRGLRRLWDAWRSGAGEPAAGPRASPTDPMGLIRWLYARFLWIMAGAGFPRAPDQTPYEYLRRLRGAPVAGEPDASRVTEAYVRARYGNVMPSSDDIAEVQSCVDRLATLAESVAASREANHARPRP